MLYSMVKGARAAMSVAVGLGLLVAAVAADAAAFRTRFDPQFSTGFQGVYGVNLWWQGTASITVPDACVSPLGFCNSGVILDDYAISFYNGDPSGSGTLITSVIPGLTPSPTLVTFDANEVANGMALVLDLAGPLTLGSGSFYPTLIFAPQYSDGTPVTGSTSLWLYTCANRACNPLTNETAPTITWVPEPAPVFLAGVALMALWLTRRRIERSATGRLR